jgi:excisionase family DNA binding protein
MNDKLVFTVQEVAKILHSSPNYIYGLIYKGYLPAIKLGSMKVLRSSLEKFLIVNEGNDLSNLNDIKKLIEVTDE